MNFYFSAPVWEDQHQCPNTSKRAKPVSFASVSGKPALVVSGGRYRSAVLNGTFLVADGAVLPKTGWHKVEVYCLWFGLRLKTRGIHMAVNMSTATVLNDYKGPVVSDLGL